MPPDDARPLVVALSSLVALKPKFSMLNLSFVVVVVVVAASTGFIESLSSVEPVFVADTDAACLLFEFMSSICFVAEAPVVGLGPVMGARPDGVSASTVK